MADADPDTEDRLRFPRCDIGDPGVKDYCGSEGIPIVMEIPFKREIASAYAKGTPLIEVFPDYRERFRALFARAAALAKP